jgi:hypothetical protein
MGNRIFYACQGVQMTPPTEAEYPELQVFTSIKGLQSVGINTNFTLEPIYQLGQLSLYENYEEIPEIEVSLNKVIDGYPLIYSYAIGLGDVITKTNMKSALRLSLFPDTTRLAGSGGSPTSQVQITPAYLSSVTYTFPTEGNFTEEVSLVANNKVWGNYGSFTPYTSSQQEPLYGAGADSGSVLRRGQLNLAGCIFPTDLGSVNTVAGSGTKITNITITANFGREQLRTLGRRGPYLRYINFPMEITAEFEVQATEAGDRVDGAEKPVNTNNECVLQRNLEDQEIRIALCDGTVINLGKKCKLTSVGFSGGDTGGGNATITYSYQTYNDFTVTKS